MSDSTTDNKLSLDATLEGAGGHITPIPYPYLAHALMAAGFDMPHIGTDKVQFPSLFWFILLYLPIRLTAALTWNKERNKYRTLDNHNAPIIAHINAPAMLLGRSIVVLARKPA